MEDVHIVFCVIATKFRVIITCGAPFGMKSSGLLSTKLEENRASLIKKVLIFPVIIKEENVVEIKFHLIFLNGN